MTAFTTTVKQTAAGALYVDIPNEVMEKCELKMFMAGSMTAKNGEIRLFGFEKTAKIKVDLGRKTIALAKKIMKIEGYGSLDETISSVIRRVFTKDETHVVYLYPVDFLQGGYTLIDDYEKKGKKNHGKKKHRDPGTPASH